MKFSKMTTAPQQGAPPARVGWHDLPIELQQQVVAADVLSPLDHNALSLVDRRTHEVVRSEVVMQHRLLEHDCRLSTAACYRTFSRYVTERCAALPPYRIGYDALKDCGLYGPTADDSYGLTEAYHRHFLDAFATGGDCALVNTLIDEAFSSSYHELGDLLYSGLRMRTSASKRALSFNLGATPTRASKDEVTCSFMDYRRDIASWSLNQPEIDADRIASFHLSLDNEHKTAATLMSMLRAGTANDVRVALDFGYLLPAKVTEVWTCRTRGPDGVTYVVGKSLQFTQTPLTACRSRRRKDPERGPILDLLLRAGAEDSFLSSARSKLRFF